MSKYSISKMGMDPQRTLRCSGGASIDGDALADQPPRDSPTYGCASGIGFTNDGSPLLGATAAWTARDASSS